MVSFGLFLTFYFWIIHFEVFPNLFWTDLRVSCIAEYFFCEVRTNWNYHRMNERSSAGFLPPNPDPLLLMLQ